MLKDQFRGFITYTNREFMEILNTSKIWGFNNMESDY